MYVEADKILDTDQHFCIFSPWDMLSFAQCYFWPILHDVRSTFIDLLNFFIFFIGDLFSSIFAYAFL